MARLEVKNKHQQDTCYTEIGIYALNMDTISSAIWNTLGRTCVIVYRQRIALTLILLYLLHPNIELNTSNDNSHDS